MYTMKVMDIMFLNAGWMLYNISLALVAVIFGWLTYKTQSTLLKYIFGIIWLLFLPNTIYMLTDIEHVPEFLVLVPEAYQPLYFFEYALLFITAIATFIFAMYPFELTIKKTKSKLKIFEHDLFFIGMNFLIAFGMVLGRVQRTNSWDVVFNIPKVLQDTIHVLITPELLLLFLFFG